MILDARRAEVFRVERALLGTAQTYGGLGTGRRGFPNRLLSHARAHSGSSEAPRAVVRNKRMHSEISSAFSTAPTTLFRMPNGLLTSGL